MQQALQKLHRRQLQLLGLHQCCSHQLVAGLGRLLQVVLLPGWQELLRRLVQHLVQVLALRTGW